MDPLLPWRPAATYRIAARLPASVHRRRRAPAPPLRHLHPVSADPPRSSPAPGQPDPGRGPSTDQGSDPEPRPGARAASGGPEPGPLVIGVLGGIASGKSAAARLLAGADGAVIDADALAHAVLSSDAVTALVAERFGPAALGADGRPDRAALARIVFEDAGARADLEGWIHPRVRARIRAALEEAHAKTVVVLDVPLLLENDPVHHLRERCDALVYVDAPLDRRTARAVATRGWSEDEVARREASQLSQDAKRAAADHVVANDADLDALAERCAALRARLLAERRDRS